MLNLFIMNQSKINIVVALRKRKMCLYLVLSPGIHYEKARVANATFSLAQKSLAVDRYFLIQHVVKKDGSFVIIGERKKEKPLHQSHCIEAIATKPVQSDIVFSRSNLSYSYLMRIQKMQFLFGKFLTYAGNKQNNNSFFDLYRKYQPLSLHQPCKLCSVLRSRAIFFGIYEKTIVIALFCSSAELFSYLFTDSNFLFLRCFEKLSFYHDKVEILSLSLLNGN